MPRFVVLRHESPRGKHFDLMLEAEGVLKTWSLPSAPSFGVDMECVALPDHRRAYLDYEGPISGGRGLVVRWDRGEYATQLRTDAEWVVKIAGERISGTLTMRQSKDDPQKYSVGIARC